MTTSQPVKLFESTRVRSHWDAAQEKWYFSVVDVVELLTDSINPTDYLKKLRKRPCPRELAKAGTQHKVDSAAHDGARNPQQVDRLLERKRC